MQTIDAAAAANTIPLPAQQRDEIGGVLRDALKRSFGSSQRLFLEHSDLSPDARGLAAEALEIIEGLEDRIASAYASMDDAETTIVRLKEKFDKALEAVGKSPEDDPSAERLEDALYDTAMRSTNWSLERRNPWDKPNASVASRG